MHATVRFNLVSGRLLLEGLADHGDKHRAVRITTNRTLSLYRDQTRELDQRSNRISFGSLEFLLKYDDMSDQQYEDWVTTRNRLWESRGLALPSQKIIAFPYTHDRDFVKRQGYTIHRVHLTL